MLNLVEGWTEPIRDQLKADGVAQDLTGMTVVLLLYSKDGTLQTPGGSTTVTDIATGEVSFTPASSDLVNSKSPYSQRWKVTDSGGKVAFFPNAEAERWNVRKP